MIIFIKFHQILSFFLLIQIKFYVFYQIDYFKAVYKYNIFKFWKRFLEQINLFRIIFYQIIINIKHHLIIK